MKSMEPPKIRAAQGSFSARQIEGFKAPAANADLQGRFLQKGITMPERISNSWRPTNCHHTALCMASQWFRKHVASWLRCPRLACLIVIWVCAKLSMRRLATAKVKNQ